MCEYQSYARPGSPPDTPLIKARAHPRTWTLYYYTPDYPLYGGITTADALFCTAADAEAAGYQRYVWRAFAASTLTPTATPIPTRAATATATAQLGAPTHTPTSATTPHPTATAAPAANQGAAATIAYLRTFFQSIMAGEDAQPQCRGIRAHVDAAQSAAGNNAEAQLIYEFAEWLCGELDAAPPAQTPTAMPTATPTLTATPPNIDSATPTPTPTATPALGLEPTPTVTPSSTAIRVCEYQSYARPGSPPDTPLIKARAHPRTWTLYYYTPDYPFYGGITTTDALFCTAADAEAAGYQRFWRQSVAH